MRGRKRQASFAGRKKEQGGPLSRTLLRPHKVVVAACGRSRCGRLHLDGAEWRLQAPANTVQPLPISVIRRLKDFPVPLGHRRGRAGVERHRSKWWRARRGTRECHQFEYLVNQIDRFRRWLRNTSSPTFAGRCQPSVTEDRAIRTQARPRPIKYGKERGILCGFAGKATQS